MDFSNKLQTIPVDLARTGFAVVPAFISEQEILGLSREMSDLLDQGRFTPAGIGNRAKHRQDEAVRRDLIHWFEAGAESPAQKQITTCLESLRLECNRELFLGLDSLEGHFAIYEPGGFYRRHKDAFDDDDSRVLSIVLYLNEDWRPGDGGELRIHAEVPVTIEPRGGTLVVFLSREIEHEVLESRVTRKSFAGWFKNRPQTG